MRALGFVGASRLAAADRLLPEAIRQWREQWCFQASTAIACECREEGAAPSDTASCEWKQVDTGKGKLWIGGSWRQLVLGTYAAEAPHDAIGTELLATAQQALAKGLLEALGIQASPALQDAAPQALGAAMTARVLIQAKLGEQLLLQVLVDASLLAEFLSKPTKPLPMVQRASAIGGARLQVKVSLPFSSLSVGEVNGLRAGDVLQGDTHFLEPLNLTVRDNHTVAKGYLARRGEYLALQLAAHEQ
jgi:flagellar motor switch/type III secretory pathway protein FliN